MSHMGSVSMDLLSSISLVVLTPGTQSSHHETRDSAFLLLCSREEGHMYVPPRCGSLFSHLVGSEDQIQGIRLY